MNSLASFIPEKIKSHLASKQAYLVGGFLRDYLLNQEISNSSIALPGLRNKDFDFVIFNESNLKSLVEEISIQSESSFVELDKDSQTYRIVNNDWQADFAAPKGESLEEDLKARDFTINSIAATLSDFRLVDPTNGCKDLKEGIIRANHKDSLKSDPLRMLRAFRFHSQLQVYKEFSICPETTLWIQEQKELIHLVAPERVSYEIWQMLSSQNSFVSLKQILASGLWEEIFPEFKELRKVPENDFHHLPLIEHTFELVKQYEKIVKDKLTTECKEFIDQNNLSRIPLEAVIKMGCLLHDIAKPATWQIIGNKHTFHGHDSLGAEISEKIGKRLLWPKTIIQCLSKLVQYHLRPFHIAPLENEPSEKAERRFFRKLEDSFYPLIALAWADLLSTRGPMISEEAIEASEKRLFTLCQNYEAFCKQEEKEPLLLKGKVLEEAIKEAALPKSKLIKELLNELRELQLNKEISCAEEAYKWFVEKGKQLSIELV